MKAVEVATVVGAVLAVGSLALPEVAMAVTVAVVLVVVVAVEAVVSCR